MDCLLLFCRDVRAVTLLVSFMPGIAVNPAECAPWRASSRLQGLMGE
jgi:hypothetical protein